MSKDFPIKTTFTAVDRMSATLGKMRKNLSTFTASAEMRLRGIDRTLGRARQALTAGLTRGFVAASAGAVALGGSVGWVMKQFSKVEDATANFTPLMGGVGRAKELVQALNRAAADTPFEFENLAGVAQTLLPVMGGDIDKIIKTMKMMGDTAGGNAAKMEGIAYGFTKAFLKGKVDMESLNIIGEKGVPIIAELGKMYGKTSAEIFEMSRKGQISTTDLTKVFERMTSEGGMFYKGMDIASKTLSGRISTLIDEVDMAAAELGEQLAPVMKDLVGYLTKAAQKAGVWVRANKDLIKSKITDFVKKLREGFKSFSHWAHIIVGYLKKLPEYFETIAYWAPKIAIAVGVFYAVSTAVHVATVAVQALNGIISIVGALGKAKALVPFFSTKLPAAVGMSTAAASGLSIALGAVFAAGVGAAIGYTIYKQIIEPLMEAQSRLDDLTASIADTMGRDLSKRSEGQLKKDLGEIEKAKKMLDAGIGDKDASLASVAMNYLPGAGFFKDYSNLMLNKQRQRLEGAMAGAHTRANVAKYAETPGGAVSEVSPWEEGFGVPGTTSETREVVEVTLRDETGRARVTKGKSGGSFKLVHTGAATR